MSCETPIPPEALDPARKVHGAKAVVFLPEGLPVMLRDDFAHIPFPDCWDFPGGGRDPGESAVDCVIREAREELNLRLRPEDFYYARRYENPGEGEVWFFAVRPQIAQAEPLELGDEGQCWRFMSEEEFLKHDKAIPRLQARLAAYLAGV
ncbi:NUDIX hydrolase [Pseudooceanicola sp. CBS1P-1]|uniref:NUDIX domain-containing protein n=1 Tax=Pseudooceanicola albus TaxID=2692189 RepID=A0A6L7GA93_9RHOB|nr:MULTISPECIES: NUDIX hydrolase [Pseudooceanicola]MBT9386657.1 NUDIX hydrolase [Pseudooceanicola endophyticus]MXN20931.1 NUDIX domain-containing protein [Pseudooceanicola albus]